MAKFLTINPTSGSGSKTVTITAPENRFGERIEVLTITGGGITRQVQVTQEGAQIPYDLYVWIRAGEDRIKYRLFLNGQLAAEPPAEGIVVSVTLPVTGQLQPQTFTNTLTNSSGNWPINDSAYGDEDITECTVTPASGEGYTIRTHPNIDPTSEPPIW